MPPHLTHKTCKACLVEKPVSEFYVHKGYFNGRCKPCCIEANQKWVQANKERHVALQRRSYLRRTYDMTPDDYERMVEEHEGVCAICSNATEGRLHIDHCHATGVIRGLLCGTCNQALGLMGDDPDRLQRAAEYLREAA